MKIAFIRPGMFGRQSRDAMQPLVFAIIKAITPEDVEIVFVDEMVEEIPGDLEADAVAMTVDTFSARRAYKLADFFKDKGMKVIMGGLPSYNASRGMPGACGCGCDRGSGGYLENSNG